MVVWRFSRHEALDGRGGLLASARWHTRGTAILYCAPNPATALLEVLVNGGVRDPDALGHHRFLKIGVPDDVAQQQVDEARLPVDWSRHPSVTRAWGDRWLQERRSLVLTVRCVLVPETYNVLINPRHPDAGRVNCIASFPYPVDSRLVGRD